MRPKFATNFLLFWRCLKVRVSPVLRMAVESPATTRMPADYRPDIDGLRAIAISCVVTFHAFPENLPGGFVGVDIFFVISGFLISSIILKGLRCGEFSFADFYAARIRRLFPTLCLLLIVMLVVGWYVFLPDEFKSLGKYVFAGLGFVSNLVMLPEFGYFDSAADSKPLLHLWSLGIEEQFYIVWPLVLYLAWKRRINAFRVTLLLAGASFASSAWLVRIDPVAAFYLPLTRFWEILAGCLLAQVHPMGAPSFGGVFDRPWRSNLLALSGVALLLIALFELDKQVPYPGYWALLPVTATVMMISAGPNAWLNRWILSRSAMVWVGLVSYALYLWHWPVLVLLRLTSDQAPSAGERIAAIGASVVLAWLTYELVDKPVRYGRHRARKVIALCTIGAAIGLAGAATYQLQGVPSRFSDSLLRLASFKYDARADYREGTCFLRRDQDSSAFQSCSTPLPRIGARSIVLWGDSHAAHLYPGMKHLLEGTFKLTQLTSSACPPIIGLDLRGRCNAINDYVLWRIGDEHPDRVILAAAWGRGFDPSLIVDTIRALHERGIRDIELIGPVPQWKDGLPRVLYRNARRDALFHRIPLRTNMGLISGKELDAKMSAVSKAQDVTYISPLSLLCNADGCLTLTGDGTPITWDDSHLTAEGSRFLVSHFPPEDLAP